MIIKLFLSLAKQEILKIGDPFIQIITLFTNNLFHLLDESKFLLIFYEIIKELCFKIQLLSFHTIRNATLTRRIQQRVLITVLY